MRRIRHGFSRFITLLVSLGLMSGLLPVYPVSALEYSDGAALDRTAYSATFHHVVDPASWTVWTWDAPEILDGDAGSYAQAGEQRILSYVQVDFPTLEQISRVTLDSPDGAFPGRIKVQYCSAASIWTDIVVDFTAMQSHTEIVFPYPVSAKGILVQKLDEDALEKAWQIAELNFYRSSAVTKRGVCASRYNTQPAKLNQLNVSWYYDWGISIPASSSGLDYVPMVWGSWSVNETNLAALQAGIADGTYTNLLTFNEPDLAEQSNMTVEQALELWPSLEALGVRLGSPCPANAANYCGGWLEQFMEGCRERGYRVDFIAVHCYQDVCDPGAVSALQSLLTHIYEKYGLPIWLTEFGAVDVGSWYGNPNPNYSEVAAVQYIQSSTAMLESLGFVERYSWFVDNYGGGANPENGRYSRLFNDDDTLAQTGAAYRDAISRQPMWMKTEALADGVVGAAYLTQVELWSGTAPYVFEATGLPSGLSINSVTGVISGTAAQEGIHAVTVKATDAAGQYIQREFFLTVGQWLDRNGWSANFSRFLGEEPWFVSTNAASILDGDSSTVFTSTRPQTTNDVFQIICDGDIWIKKIVFTVGATGEYPEAFKIQCLQEEKWWDLSAEINCGDTTEILFSQPVRTTGIILQLQDDADRFWSIAEINIWGCEAT